MLNKKYFFIVISILTLSAASAHASGIILRHDDGGIKYLNHYDAVNTCPKDTHIPTIRDLAKESQARGAKGILEINKENSDKVPNGYEKISALNPDGEKDEFYFSAEGYIRPDDDFGDNWFWSSSVTLNDKYAYILRGFNGLVDFSFRPRDFQILTVLCVPNNAAEK